MSKDPPVSVLAILGSLVEERIGLHYRAEEVELFWSKVSSRMEVAGFESALDYYYYLRYDDPTGTELDALIDSLVVGETYLFREIDALRAAIKYVLTPAIDTRGRARVWCAGCASGEEPYSLGMLAADAGILPSLEIIASDVSERALRRAMTGTLSQRALRAVDTAPALAERWLTYDAEGQPSVLRPLREAIRFERVNLIDKARILDLGSFDVIFCRNVLIYFRDSVVQQVVGYLANALRPNGRLVVGASESLLRFGTALRFEERGGAFFYTKEDK